jgi:hypothetical protein
MLSPVAAVTGLSIVVPGQRCVIRAPAAPSQNADKIHLMAGEDSQNSGVRRGPLTAEFS